MQLQCNASGLAYAFQEHTMICCIHHVCSNAILHLNDLRIIRPPREKTGYGKTVQSIWLSCCSAIYILLASLVALNVLIFQRDASLYGLLIILIGLPIYFFVGRNKIGNS
ncbi:MAG: hypothetical protein IPH33_12610 [Bacteroidetes bacterium]|nr:hypothetical protein [Bacteroidota bacterium]